MRKFLSLAAAVALAISAAFSPSDASACSRILYVGSDSTLRIVGRSLDWKTPIPTNIYVYPKGIKKMSHSLKGAFSWTSKYGAVYAVSYDSGVTEGMNEKGLVINGLFCKGTVYGNASTEGRPPMSLAVFVAWLLDMNATTDEVVDVVTKHDFNISGATFDGGTVSALHWGVTDASGKSAMIEFVDGDIKVYEGQDLPVLTNDPTYPAMNAINDYWQKIGGANFLPGRVASPDRFVRGYFFDNNVQKVSDHDLAFSIVRSIMANVSVPYLYEVNGDPNVSSTQWRTYADLSYRRYYFDLVTNPGVFYINLDQCDLSEGAPILKIDTSKSQDFIGNCTSKLVVSQPFTPMY
ncbi:MAG: linear amide C-N hydrolase [Pseudoflavonifractor sp.]|nr:linear amide C-N hydrolase [Alloprevotella sp.]MCM1117018.1 linear amide C-N hydrolase [Pseudoflavonifractor sp.]